MPGVASKFKNYGVGVGLRAPHLREFLQPPSGPRPADWVEVISDNLMPGPNFFNSGAKANLLKVRENFNVALHGVSMSLGSSSGLDLGYLKNLKSLVKDVDPIAVSDHLCWTQVGGRHTHDLNPLPYSETMLDFVAAQIARVQDVLGRRILVENVSSYLTYSHSEMREEEFLAELVRRADCGLLLDLNNVYVSAANHGFDAREFLRRIPADRVGQIHLAGHHRREDGFLIDTHDAPVCEDVWALYEWYGREYGHASAMIERDAQIPEWSELAAELRRLREGFRPSAALALASEPPAVSSLLPAPDLDGEWTPQHQWVDALLGDSQPPRIQGDSKLDAASRFEIYREGFWIRLTAAIASDFARFKAKVGEEAFLDLVTDALRARPSRSSDLNELSLTFVEAMRAHGHPELALLEEEWAETQAIWARSLPVEESVETRFEKLQTENPEHFDRICVVFHPSLQILAAQKTVFWFDTELRQKSFSQTDWPAIVALSSNLPLSEWEGVPGLTPANVQAWTQEGLIRGYKKISRQKGVQRGGSGDAAVRAPDFESDSRRPEA